MRIGLFGIPNCDTVRKARKWLDAEGVAYVFHDYKKEGADSQKLAVWADAVGWEKLLNTRGTTFRKLPPSDKEEIDQAKAIALMTLYPSTIKRPVVEHAAGLLVGFDEVTWAEALC